MTLRVVLVGLLLMVSGLAGCLAGSGDRPPGPADDGEGASHPAPGWPPLENADLRPGIKVGPEPEGGGCTTNFLFSSPDNRTLYIGTGAHCLVGYEVGDRVVIAAGAAEGTLVYCSWATVLGSDTCESMGGPMGTVPVTDRSGFENDFALIELDARDRGRVHPAVFAWGGPTGLETDPAVGDRVLTFGNSTNRDAGPLGQTPLDEVDPREGYVKSTSEWTTFVQMAGPSIGGDSGSAVLTGDGKALGVMQTVEAGDNGVVNLDRALAFLHEHTDLQVELKTFRTLEDPILPEPTTDPIDDLNLTGP